MSLLRPSLIATSPIIPFLSSIPPLLQRPSTLINHLSPFSLLRRRPFLSLPLIISTQFNLPSLLQELWDSVLRAVPKKKTSHSKKRHRQLAGKALKDVTALNRCSGCGNIKRYHVLCPDCVADIHDIWKGKGSHSKGETTNGGGLITSW